MASDPLIDKYVAALRRRLPPAGVDELIDGLLETYQHKEAECGNTGAASATIADFGTVDEVVAAFVRESPGRRVAIGLLTTGPVVGACWGLSLFLGKAWSWPVPVFARVAFGLMLCVVVGALLAVAVSRGGYRRTRLAAWAGAGLIVLDIAMITAAVVVAPAIVWPMTAAIPASVARIGFTAWHLPNVLASSTA